MTDPYAHDIMSIDEATASPEQVPTAALRSALAHEENLVRTRGAKVAAAVVGDDPEMVAEHTSQLVENLDHERTNVVVHSALALASVVETAPDRAAEAVGPIVDLLDEDPPIVQSAASQFVRTSITEAPETFLSHVDQLVERTLQESTEPVPEDAIEATADDNRREIMRDVNEDEGRRQWATRLVTANMLAELARVEPTAVAPHVADLAALLDPESDDVGVTTTVADIVGSVAEHDPALADDAVDPLIAVLDHYDEPTVATAVTALGFLDDPAAIEPLRAVDDDEDRDEDLRELAAETAAFVEQRAEQ